MRVTSEPALPAENHAIPVRTNKLAIALARLAAQRQERVLVLVCQVVARGQSACADVTVELGAVLLIARMHGPPNSLQIP